VTTSTGGIPDCEEVFSFDLNHRYVKGVAVPVCSRLVRVLSTKYSSFWFGRLIL
jgi:hypothetical protein